MSMIKSIFNVHTFSINDKKYSSPTFGSRLPNDTFENIKDIPHLRCASCDDVMLTKSEIGDIKRRLLLNAKELFACGKLNAHIGSEAYAFTSNLATRYPRRLLHEVLEDDEVVKKIEVMPKPVRIQISEIGFASKHAYKTSSQVISILEPYSNLFKGEYKNLYDLMKYYSLKSPNKTFYKIFQGYNVNKYHFCNARLKKEEVALFTQNVFDKVEKLSQKLKPEDKEIVCQTLQKCTEYLALHPYTEKTKKEYIKDKFTPLLSELSNKSIAKKIAKEFEKLPETSFFADSIIAKSPNDEELFDELLSQLLITFDHVKVKSEKGSNSQGNGIYLCKYCNFNRGTLPYPFLFKQNPEMPKYIQKQISRISTFITGGKLLGYSTFPVKIKKTLFEETDNAFVLDINNYLKNKKKSAKKALKEANAELDTSKKILEDATDKYDVTLANFLKYKNMLKQAQKKLDEATKNKKESEKNLLRKSREKDCIDAIIANDKSFKNVR